MNQLRLALVDGNTLLRECLAELCDIEPDLRVIGQADGGPAAVALVRRDRPDVVLLDAETADGPVEVLHSWSRRRRRRVWSCSASTGTHVPCAG